jgi:hypothetical protein
MVNFYVCTKDADRAKRTQTLVVAPRSYGAEVVGTGAVPSGSRVASATPPIG